MSDLITKPRAIATIQRARKINSAIEKHESFSIDRLDKLSKSYSSNSSQYLIGILGGACGGTVAYISSLVGASLFISMPICLVAGVAGFILAWRGRDQRKLERQQKQTQTIIDAQLARIKALPANTPQEVKDFEWQEYKRLSQMYQVDSTTSPIWFPIVDE